MTGAFVFLYKIQLYYYVYKLSIIFISILYFSFLNAQVDYKTQIQPIFNDKCTSCHVAGSPSGGLVLTSYNSLMAGGTSGASIIAGNHQNSLLWNRINDGSMPPSSNDVSSANVELVKKWINEGALDEYLTTETESVPTDFALHDNYPNPFNPTTTLRFDLPKLSDVNMIIYNMLGQKVKTFNIKSTPAGDHSVTWNATNDFGSPVSAGVYLYQLKTKDFVKTKKMILLK